jgi:hypothetical protein
MILTSFRLIDLYAASGNGKKTIEWLYRMSSIFRDRNDSVTPELLPADSGHFR